MRVHPLSLRDPGQPPKPWDTLTAEIAALPAWAKEVGLVGADPVDSPHLLKTLAALRDAGRAPMLFTHGLPLGRVDRLRTLHEHGCRYLGLYVHGAPADHDARVGKAGSFDRLLTTLRTAGPLDLQVAMVLLPDVAVSAPETLARHALDAHALLHVLCLDPAGPDPRPLLDATWRAASRHGARVRATGVPLWPPRTPNTAPGPADAALIDLARAGDLPDAARIGTSWRQRTDPAQVDPTQRAAAASLLAAMGAPVLDLPACEGGTAADRRDLPTTCAPCVRVTSCPGPGDLPGTPSPPARLRALPPRARVHVVVPPIADHLLLLSSYPALVAALVARGANARLHTPYDITFHPTDLRRLPAHGLRGRLADTLRPWVPARLLDRLHRYRPPEHLLSHPLAHPEPEHRQRALADRFWQTLDLRDADAVIVPDYAAAARALPLLPPTARLVITDFHMLAGHRELFGTLQPIERLDHADLAGQASHQHPFAETSPVPLDRLDIHACFRPFASLYAVHGVPLPAIRWRPYPAHLGHFTPLPSSGAPLAGGRHLRDGDTLVRASAHLQGPPLDVITDPDPALRPVPTLRFRPPCPLPDFIDAVRACTFLVLPMRPDPHHAAGLTVLTMAQAAGKPIVASATPAMIEHVQDGVDGLLVPPDDADALGKAIRRLQTDPALHQRLSDGARQAGRRLSVETWADELLSGAPRSGRPIVPPLRR